MGSPEQTLSSIWQISFVPGMIEVVYKKFSRDTESHYEANEKWHPLEGLSGFIHKQNVSLWTAVVERRNGATNLYERKVYFPQQSGSLKTR